MTVQFRDAVWTKHDATTTSSPPAPVMPTHQAGDILLVAVACTDSRVTLTTSTPGWALLDAVNSGGSNIGGNAAVFWKRASSSSEAAPSITAGAPYYASGLWSFIVAAYSGCVDVGDPWDDYIASVPGSRTPWMDHASLTSGGVGRRLVMFSHWSDDNGENRTHTPPASATERIDADTGFVPSAHLCDEEVASSGATGTRRISYGASNEYPAGVAVLLVAPNVAPNAPSPTYPIAGQVLDRDVTNRFTWDFSDPDVGDVQSAYDLRYRPVGGTAWTTVSGGASSHHDFAAGTFSVGDWEWQVRTTDNAGNVGPYSSSETFTVAATPAAPTISDPANNGTVNTDPYMVRWSAPNQTAYHARRVADDGAGSPDTATVYEDTGTVESSSARSQAMSFPTNGRDEHVQVRVRHDGLWSSWASVKVAVSYTPPATPSLTATPDSPVAGAVRVQPSHPAPVGDEPAVVSVELWRRETSDASTEERIRAGKPPTSPLDVYSSRSGVSYEFRIVAHGDNGTSSASAWTG